MAASTWQTPLMKLLGLLVLLPWTVTYLHFYYYTFWRYEYCFVGPPTSTFGTTRWKEYNVAAVDEVLVDSKIRARNSAFDASDSGLYGIYAPQSPKKKKKKGENELDRRTFRQKYSTRHSSSARPSHSYYLSVKSSGWPSLTQAAMMVSGPSSTLSKYSYVYEGQDTAANNEHQIVFVENDNQNRWCLQSARTGEKWCSSPLDNYPQGTIYPYPPGGTWHPLSSSESKPPVSVSCPAPSTAHPSDNKTKHPERQNGKQNQNVQFLLHHPTTALLLLLNTGLAYHYWNRRIPPSAVGKSYHKICNQHEYWRSFSGATAHFEPLHLGFNMMSLHTLGKELEGGFGSVVFLVYNVALVVMCTMVMMGMVYGRLVWARYRAGDGEEGGGGLQEEEKRWKETSTVGYSGVLFAWMVITTLERNEATCPIPFFSDVCFSTHHIPGVSWLKFNIAPIVSLFVAQFIMPRVSFMGHLAGIACGFGLHWGWGMPPLEICSPNVLIGGVYLVFCLGISRRLIPVIPSSNEIVEDDNGLCSESGEGVGVVSTQNCQFNSTSGSVTEDAMMTGKQRKKERELDEVLRKQRTLLLIRNLTGIAAVASMFFNDFTSSLVLSQVILFAYFIFGTQSSCIVWTYTHINRAESGVIESEKQRSGVLWKGYIVAVTLVIVVDSMSIASWVVLKTLISADRSPKVTLVSATLFMMVRTFINIMGLIASSKVLHDFGQVGGGIFPHLFSWVLSSSKKVGDGLFLSQIPLWTAFEGRGVRLGTRTRTT